MSGSTRVFLPGERGHDEVRGHVMAALDGGERVVVAASDGDAVRGAVEELPLRVLEERRASAGEDVALAIVDVVGQGPALALRAASTRVADAATAPVRWEHTSLAVADLDAALRFYREAFGFDVLFEERGMTDQIRGMTGIAEVTCDLAQLSSPTSGHVLELIAFRGVPDARAAWAPTAAGRAHVAFSVADLEGALAGIRTAGAQMLGTVTAFESGPSAYLREPSGSFLELSEG